MDEIMIIGTIALFALAVIAVVVLANRSRR